MARRLPVPHRVPESSGALDPHVPAPGASYVDLLRPGHAVVHQGYTLIAARPDGSICGEGREGLYDFDTRLLCRWRLTLDGRAPRPVAAWTAESERFRAVLCHPLRGGEAAGPRLPQDAVEIDLARRVGCGMEETFVLRHHGMAPVELELALDLAADFADIQEVGAERRQQGALDVGWDPVERTLRFDYRATRGERRLHRALCVRVCAAGSPPMADGQDGLDRSAGANGSADGAPLAERRECEPIRQPPGWRLRFRVALPPHGTWEARLAYESLVDGVWRRPADAAVEARAGARERWRHERARLDCPHSVVGPAFERAAEDLFALRNWELDAAPGAWVPNAGVPTYTGLFGRDTLTAAWQAALLGPEMLSGALALSAATQALQDSPFHDAEPGKMIHEARRGPLSELEIIPHRAYYGTQTSPSFFVVSLAEHWHWTGDAAALLRHRDAALAALAWAERSGDADGDGFLETVPRSPEGLKNHGWKDSDEAIRYPDGSLVEPPLATVEEQAFHLVALERMAEVLVALDEEERAEHFLERARTLRRRWHEAFWMPDEGFYAMALDSGKRRVRSIGSNPGHALAAGAVPAEHARAVADRLLAPDLFSGWGVRTLSAAHPSYNPFGYHLGTVWPVENATFALGFKRHGLDDHLERLAAGLFAAAARLQAYRLPEALGGHSRDECPLPTVYPRSNCPQAWSASAVVHLVQTLLGVYPFAPARLLALVRPRLPEWLPSVTLRRLRVGDAVVSLRFERRSDGTTEHEVVEREGALLVTSAPPPDANGRESPRERMSRWLLEHVPGRLARTARIALGVETAV